MSQTAGKARIAYTPRTDATPEAELFVLANVYRFILDRCAQQESTERTITPNGCDATDEETNPNLSHDGKESP
jgi:hypothetical protein